MLYALFFGCLFSVPFSSAAVRVAVKEAQEVPWRRTVVVGTLLSHLDAGEVGVGVPERDLRAGDLIVTPKGDAYDNVQSLLIRTFGGRKPDRAAYGKLMDSLRRCKQVEPDFAQGLEARLSDASSTSVQHHVPSGTGGGQVVEQLVVHQDGDPVGVAIVRYASQDHRTSEGVTGLQHLLSGVELSKAVQGLFLRYFAQSHTAEEFAEDTGAEVLLIRELYFGSLREVVEVSKLSYSDRLDSFLRTFVLVERLNKLGIPHLSEFTPDTIFVRGGASGPQPENIALSPTILLAKSEISAGEMWSSDIRQLGTLLRYVSSGEFANEDQPAIDVLLAFGKAMEVGAIPGDERALTELVDLMRHMTSGTPEILAALRLQYLRRAVDAEVDVAPAQRVGA